MYGTRELMLLVVLMMLAVLRCHHAAVDDYVNSYEEDGHQIAARRYRDKLLIECYGARLLDVHPVAREEPATETSAVQLLRCRLPETRSLADTIAAFNITLQPRGTLVLGHILAPPLLAATHFTGLEELENLYISADYDTQLSLERGCLTSLRNLRYLTLENVVLLGELDAPLALRELYLSSVEGVEWVPAVTPTLESLYIYGWSVPRPPVLAHCDLLHELRLIEITTTALPADWLANCSRLEKLHIMSASDLTELPSKLLLGTSALTHLTITRTSLESLPAGLFDHSPRLHTLDLSFNRLPTLPRELFAVARGVQHLNLSGNELDSGALAALAPLEELTELIIENIPLGDICGTDGYSPIRNSTKLRVLSLPSTGVSRICRDWCDDMTSLHSMDLRWTNISELPFRDLQFNRSVQVLLWGAPAITVSMSREEFSTVRDLPRNVSVQVYATLACDCRMYWTRRALELGLPVLRQVAGELFCAGGQRLRDVAPGEMTCSRQEECPAAALPAACTCDARPDGDSSRDRLLVRARCEHAALRRVPRPRPRGRTPRLYHLLLRYNNITELHADDLQHNIRELDLRNNSLKRVDEETAARLGAVKGILRLAGNPLDCSCEAAPLLRALHARDPALTDFKEATCSDGSALYTAYTADCSSGAMITRNGEKLTIDCNNASLPDARIIAPPMQLVKQVVLKRCRLPAARSLAHDLAAVNVTLESQGELAFEYLEPTPQLSALHFTGLQELFSLSISGDHNSLLSSKRGFLAPLRNLHSLKMRRVVLPAAEMEALPALHELDLSDAESLEWLGTPTLESLQITGWSAPRLPVLTRCDSLRELRLSRIAATALPNGWLASCSRLEKLHIITARHLTALPPGLLPSTSSLTHLTITDTSLETLPAGLLLHSPRLHTLDLSNNRLRTLPSDIFAGAWGVQHLDLSSNELVSGALAALAPLEELTELDLGHNPRLGDVCGRNGFSPIRNSIKLKRLLLPQTCVSCICSDWRDDMTSLILMDLQFNRSVWLEGAPLAAVRMSREEFSTARDLPRGLRVQVDAPLACDCRMYWTRRALELGLPVLRQVAGELRCAGGRRLRDVAPGEMCLRREQCTVTALPAGCTCDAHPDASSEYEWLLVRVRCEHASLPRVPRLRPRDRTRTFYHLLLRNNNITELDADFLEYDIKELDLRNNSLRRVDEETAARLGAVEGMLRLAGNPLDCSCEAAPLLRALHARDPALTDLRNATCSDGRALYAAPTADCPQHGLSTSTLVAYVASALAMLLVLALATAVFLASRQRRFFARAVLRRWGVTWSAAESEGDAARRYDAYLAFSHVDEAVALQVMAQLEPTYRLCVHARDWIPGLGIGSQVMRSVRESRRTVALVSRHFLLSAWALAEFRAAHAASMLDARPRLVVVFLEDPAALADDMDEELQHYIATHTYLRWGDPWFWEKLVVSLPRPRAPPPAPAAL